MIHKTMIHIHQKNKHDFSSVIITNYYNYISGITLKNYPDKIKRKEGREIFANS